MILDLVKMTILTVATMVSLLLTRYKEGQGVLYVGFQWLNTKVCMCDIDYIYNLDTHIYI